MARLGVLAASGEPVAGKGVRGIPPGGVDLVVKVGNVLHENLIAGRLVQALTRASTGSLACPR